MSDHLDFDEINPHLGLWQSETYEGPEERRWYAWLDKVERELGVEKGRTDEQREVYPYSIDYALDDFRAGMTAKQFANDVRSGMHQLITE
jgi:hypothetical protein